MNSTYTNTTEPFEKKYMPYYEEILHQLHPNCELKHDIILDQQHATDRLVLHPYKIQERYGCRARTYNYREKYYDEFTIRESELPKILNGEADYMLYGFMNKAVDKIIQLIRIDLFYFAWEYPKWKIPNRFWNEGTKNYGIAFKIKDFTHIERII
jgi:hypothetical protein